MVAQAAPADAGLSLNDVMVFALPENHVIKMKFCGRLARVQKPRHRDAAATCTYRLPLAVSGSHVIIIHYRYVYQNNYVYLQ